MGAWTQPSFFLRRSCNWLDHICSSRCFPPWTFLRSTCRSVWQNLTYLWRWTRISLSPRLFQPHSPSLWPSPQTHDSETLPKANEGELQTSRRTSGWSPTALHLPQASFYLQSTHSNAPNPQGNSFQSKAPIFFPVCGIKPEAMLTFTPGGHTTWDQDRSSCFYFEKQS